MVRDWRFRAERVDVSDVWGLGFLEILLRKKSRIGMELGVVRFATLLGLQSRDLQYWVGCKRLVVGCQS